MHIRSLALALLLSTTAASAASVSDFSLVDNGDGSVTLSWTVSGSSGMFYRGYNVAVSRGTSPNQAASTRTLVEGDSGSYMTQQGTTGNVRDAPPATGETYYYWLHYSNYSIINDTENFFFNYLGGSPGTILSAPCTGPRSYQSSGGEETLEAPESATAVTGDTVVTVVVSWSAVDGAESYQVYAGRTDSFDAASPIQMSVADTTLSYAVPAASVNAMPDYFWVVAKKGTIESDPSPAARWTRTPQTLPVTAKALSADVSAGSITIGWDDPGVVVPAGLTFTLYRNTEDDPGTAVSTGVSGPGPSFVDTGFGSIGGTSPVYYYIVNDQGLYNMVATGKTRVRHGIFVGLGEYRQFSWFDIFQDDTWRLAAHSQPVSDATRLLGLLSSGQGADSDNFHLLVNSAATKEGVSDSFALVGDESKPGDIVVFYIGTHGTKDGELALYDGWYSSSQLASAVGKIPSSVLVVGIVMACHSQTAIDPFSDNGGEMGILSWFRPSLTQERKQATALIASCRSDQFSYHIGGTYTGFGEYFIDKGFAGGHADQSVYGFTDYNGGNGDGWLTFSELAEYARHMSIGLRPNYPAAVATYNDGCLERAVAGRAPSSTSAGSLLASDEVTASTTKSGGVSIQWNPVNGAEYYRVFRMRADGSPGIIPLAFWLTETTFFDKTASDLGTRYLYSVQAVNASGLGPSADPAEGGKSSEFRDFLETHQLLPDDETETSVAALAASPSANGIDTVMQCFVAGLDPTKTDDRLRATISMSSGVPDIRPSPDLGAARVYTVMGKTNLADEAWVAPTNASHRFFQVKVELPEE